ncbi:MULTISPECIES: cobalamin-independent methionine synthase II family protein [unclassified Beijerinckia]|uniref:cobalamin-independent methionine synthase II family protein n=1 Tax=unclassified Beijerinckia TaxID=2638183 RepID=UPI00089D15B2|nr:MULTISPECIES: cobalamin-independent methionine synthase II family protein [unclassified Beijerinckia]MDH7799887.1 5-methyltetrahydropteroyltriglutamate--homocysteine methyltransferase [Beijerinckia sp. GAS462]SED41169.1 5-methyltetrahydropteroyltriglutamate--homocysteine methyltransferase [Beijerinckia sp. 28-YEA-48]
MLGSPTKIRTTHVGSLPALVALDENAADYAQKLPAAVEAVVRKQREIGIDIVNEGEYTKGGDWLSFVESRFSGFEARPAPAGEKPLLAQGKDREDFAAFYQYASERGTLFYTPGGQIKQARPIWVCNGPIAYTGQEELQREIALMQQAAGGTEAFLTSTAPASLEVYRRNEHYGSEEAYLYALADALAVEYRAIAESGLILQVDDAWLPALWDRIGIGMGLTAFRSRCMRRIEALNHALKGIPEDRVRYHLCWGSWHGPHAYDLELKEIVDIMLNVKAQAYLIEGANARHEHEWKVWETVKLPKNKILMPGVITHSTDVIEHPELVAQRITRYAHAVGKQNVVAGADCGFGGRSHPQIAWAKLKALTDGAALASKELY